MVSKSKLGLGHFSSWFLNLAWTSQSLWKWTFLCSLNNHVSPTPLCRILSLNGYHISSTQFTIFWLHVFLVSIRGVTSHHILFKYPVNVPNSITCLYRTPIFDWYLVRYGPYGSKNGCQKDMFSKEIGVHAHNTITIQSAITNHFYLEEGGYNGHWMNTIIFTPVVSCE